jgi:LysM repeat protein
MRPMSDRGLPIVDGAPACPFVAFEDDRDARAASPDHRHRCYAEVRPAPRALAHQEAYCLSSAFAVCPTFQDWARREAAQARPDEPAASGRRIVTGPEPEPPDVPPSAPGGDRAFADEREADRSLDDSWAVDDQPQRNPPRDWAAPPPWVAPAAGVNAPADDGPVPPAASGGGGLAGSFADRIAGGRTDARPAAWQGGVRETSPEPMPSALVGHDDSSVYEPAPAARRTREHGRVDSSAPPRWERPRRREAYPTLKTRMGLSHLAVPPVLLGVAAVVIAAVALFFLPALLGIGNQPGASPSPTASGAASGSAAPSGAAPSETPAEVTPVPGPTDQTYTVQPNDTMSKIAAKFGVPLQTLIDANKATVPNPNLLQIGQQLVIPAVAPTTIPGASPTSTPAAS